MILTYEIWKKGKSSRGGYSSAQTSLFGIDTTMKGWKWKIIDKDWPDDIISKFLSLKDQHLTRSKVEGVMKRKNRNKGNEKPSLVPVTQAIHWKEQYLHPNWQKVRNYILNRDGYTCLGCGDVHKTLHVHHLKYLRGNFIWNVPYYYLVTLCEDCHSEEHNRDLTHKRS